MSTCVADGEFNEELMCPLCLDSWRRPTELIPCGHILCSECARQKEVLLAQCPVCRAEVEGSQAPHRSLINMALKVPVTCNRCQWKGTREAGFCHKCPTPTSDKVAANNNETSSPADNVAVNPATQTQPHESSTIGQVSSSADASGGGGGSSDVAGTVSVTRPGGSASNPASTPLAPPAHASLRPLPPLRSDRPRPATMPATGGDGDSSLNLPSSNVAPVQPTNMNGTSGMDDLLYFDELNAFIPISEESHTWNDADIPPATSTGAPHTSSDRPQWRRNSQPQATTAAAVSLPPINGRFAYVPHPPRQANPDSTSNTTGSSLGNTGNSFPVDTGFYMPFDSDYSDFHADGDDSDGIFRESYSETDRASGARPASRFTSSEYSHTSHVEYPVQATRRRKPAITSERSEVIQATGDTPWRNYGMSKEEYEQVTRLFHYIDSDKDGRLNLPEAARLARWTNLAQTIGQVTAIIEEMDSNSNGYLTREELLTWMKFNQPDPEKLYGLTRAEYNNVMVQFHLFDKDQDGWLRICDFCALSRALKAHTSTEDARRAFAAMDTLGSGKVDLHTFLMDRVARKRRGESLAPLVLPAPGASRRGSEGSGGNKRNKPSSEQLTLGDDFSFECSLSDADSGAFPHPPTRVLALTSHERKKKKTRFTLPFLAKWVQSDSKNDAKSPGTSTRHSPTKQRRLGEAAPRANQRITATHYNDYGTTRPNLENRNDYKYVAQPPPPSAQYGASNVSDPFQFPLSPLSPPVDSGSLQDAFDEYGYNL